MSFEGRFTEANTAHIEVANIAAFSSTLEASTNYTTLELWLALRASNNRLSSHYNEVFSFEAVSSRIDDVLPNNPAHKHVPVGLRRLVPIYNIQYHPLCPLLYRKYVK